MLSCDTITKSTGFIFEYLIYVPLVFEDFMLYAGLVLSWSFIVN